jgi:ATP-binding cassette subfamily F protein 3
MIALRQLALRRGSRLLLSDIDLTLHAGWRVGVVGRNGCGKSSLFAALRGELEADQGDIGLPSGWRVAHVEQEVPDQDISALKFVIAGDSELARILDEEESASAREDWVAVAAAHHRLVELRGYDGAARAARLLDGLGFRADSHEHSVRAFSGGWRARLALARALMCPSDLLLLDEPTNHLDLDAVLWLEQWLEKYPGTLLVISHDREFLDLLCTHTVHLHESRARLYAGNYTAFERQRAEQLRQQQISFEREQTERAHLQAFIDRFKAKASKAKQAQSRMKRLAKLAGTEAVRAERALHVRFDAPAVVPHSLLQLVDVAAGYAIGLHDAADRPADTSTDAQGAVHVLDDVTLRIEAGDRIGLLGPNGAGKSTLVKTLTGVLSPLSGERVTHPDAVVGYFAQHTLDMLRPGASPIELLRDLAGDRAPTQELRDFLASWQFVGDRAFECADDFSGGERARLALALIAWRKPNVLLLDEPTNHLDLDMREALAEALADFPGALLVVSHDRHLLGLVCDTYWRVADGAVTSFDGDLDDYAAWLRRRGAAPVAHALPTPAAPARRDPTQAKAQRNELRRARQRLAEIEANLTTCDQVRAELEAALADGALYAGPADAVRAALARQQTLAAEHAQLEAQWEACYAEIEALNAMETAPR